MAPTLRAFLRFVILKWSSFCSLIFNPRRQHEVPKRTTSLPHPCHANHAPIISPVAIGLSTSFYVNVVLASSGVLGRLETLSSTWTVGGYLLECMQTLANGLAMLKNIPSCISVGSLLYEVSHRTEVWPFQVSCSLDVHAFMEFNASLNLSFSVSSWYVVLGNSLLNPLYTFRHTRFGTKWVTFFIVRGYSTKFT